MQKKILLALLTLSFISQAEDTGKMTYEKAMESHRATYGQYKGVTHEESQTAWDSYRQEPARGSAGDEPQGGKLEQVWSGSSQSVDVLWGKGDYYIDVDFNHGNQGGSVWITIDGSSLTKKVGIPSPFNYEGNYHVIFNGVRFTASAEKTSGTPTITRISKFPNMMDECTPRTSDIKELYCKGSGRRTCEVGHEERKCAYNGSWMPWRVTSSPLCVSRNQYCP